MPTLDIIELNTVIAVFATVADLLGAFTVLFGFLSVKLKRSWYLGEALPAVFFGIILGPVAARFIFPERWGSATSGQVSPITLGLMRVIIGLQLVIAGYQLPAKYVWHHWKEMVICLIPVMGIIWITTCLCVLAAVPNVSFLASLVISACVTPNDPILSQAIAKEPFADKYVARPLREITSAEAGANDGFAFPFLMLAIYLMRHSEIPEIPEGAQNLLTIRAEDVGRLGGGPLVALRNWVVETLLYVVLLAMAYGAFIGFASGKGIKFFLNRKWIDEESYVLFPTALGLFIVGTAGTLGISDLLACFAAGCALNWDGQYLAEVNRRHDEVNNCIDVLLNFGGFMYLGATMPWSEFHQPDTTGITIPRLIGLGFLVLLFRRIPAIMLLYRTMHTTVTNWKEALFFGYFGPIGVGAIYYLEHTRLHLLPDLDHADEGERALLVALAPVLYWLVLFSIIFHGLSVPALSLAYSYFGFEPILDDAVSIRRVSIHAPGPSNAVEADEGMFIAFNRFSRPIDSDGLPFTESTTREKSEDRSRAIELALAASRSRGRSGERSRPFSLRSRGRSEERSRGPPLSRGTSRVREERPRLAPTLSTATTRERGEDSPRWAVSSDTVPFASIRTPVLLATGKDVKVKFTAQAVFFMTSHEASTTMKTRSKSKITPPMAPKDNGVWSDTALCNAGLPHWSPQFLSWGIRNKAIKHNQKIVSNHFRKDWQRRVRTHFDQAGKKASRRVARQAKAAALAPRPIDKLRPVVRCPTIKYNRRVRAGRGFTLAELKEAGIPRLLAPTIGISVDARRQNLSEESLVANVERLKAYKERLILLPRRSNAVKKGDTKTDLSKVEKVSLISSALPIAPTDIAFREIKKGEMPAAIEGGAYAKLRQARSNKRYQGAREKRAKDKADAEADSKK
ncbi:hypothetical protein S7711_01528 [Stachybotrys chartarum IBT 7711]|uniref:60S ribosomal protein L13 n=1 Tax=Stachybotrys chartarum (strain CBS 109288 / IBT 7711) TaxID=1280523 RepID=A0A084BBY5_STACB|nr:hypothetical protein S7711_01528 [Stachybotrys chartarum IBT 7711]